MDFEWSKIGRTEKEVIENHLMLYAEELLSPKEFRKALTDFSSTHTNLSFEVVQTLHGAMFVIWVLFHWYPNPRSRVGKILEHKTIAEKYLETYGDRLSLYQKKFLTAAITSNFSFYMVKEMKFHKHLLLRDILLQTECIVKEKEATEYSIKGDIIFAKVIKVDNQSICIGLLPYIIPVTYYNSIIDLRESLQQHYKNLTARLLHNITDALLRVYCDILEALLTPRVMQNTDGEDIEICTVCFPLYISVREAFENMLPLMLEGDKEEFLSSAEKDDRGEIISINFPWLKSGNTLYKSWKGTVLGNIEIKKNLIKVVVNSRERAEKIKTLLEKYLENSIGKAKTVIEPLDKIKAGVTTEGSKEYSAQHQAMIQEVKEKHWEAWIDESIPALKNLTPRQAAKTKEGRERLEALLLQYEGLNNKAQNNLSAPDIKSLRHKLGMDSIL